MSLVNRISLLAKRVAQEFKLVYTELGNKISRSGHTPEGYLKTDSSGNVITVNEINLKPTPVDGKRYLQKDGEWIELTLGAAEWDSIEGKPTEFTPEYHTHDDRYFTQSQVTNLLLGKEDAIEKQSGFNLPVGTTAGTLAEGNHTHDDRYYTEDEVNYFLSQKAEVDHNHDERYYTESEIDAKMVTKSDIDHNHDDRYVTLETVTGLFDGKADSVHDHDDRYYTESEIDTKLANFASKYHNHDDRYFTEIEVTNLLSRKADIQHNHNNLYYTESEVDAKLGTKADLNHTHAEYITRDDVDEMLINKSDVGHNHDARYYTRSELDTLLQGTNLEGHTHDDRYFTKLESVNMFISKVGLNTAISDVIINLSAEIDKSAYGLKYTWADQTEMDAQTGMRNLEQGLREDERVVYQYDGASWNFMYYMDGLHTYDVVSQSTGGKFEGDIEATKFIKTGGLSTEYLKADGSTSEVLDGGIF